MHTFRAFVAREDAQGQIQAGVELKNITELPEGEVTIQVAFSSLNYKDALSATGNRGVTRQYPHTPGIDAAGTVVESNVPHFAPGDLVLVTSYDLGMNTDGGFAEMIRVPAAWVIPLPDGLTLRSAMEWGTAGLTAAMCLDRLAQVGISPASGPLVVTGATGGVGSLAVALAKKLGYHVIALTGKSTAESFLKNMGADEIWARLEWESASPKPLLKPQIGAIIDTVGGTILVNLLKSLKPNGAAAICGLVSSPQLDMTVFPFILRGIAVLGVDSAEAPHAWRKTLWEKLGKEWALPALSSACREVSLDQLGEEIPRILSGQQMGRTIVSLTSGH